MGMDRLKLSNNNTNLLGNQKKVPETFCHVYSTAIYPDLQ